MSDLTSFFSGFIGLFIGAGSTLYILKNQLQKAKERDQLFNELTLAEKEKNLIQESHLEKIKLLESNTDKLENAFKLLATEALKSNEESFLRLAESRLELFQQKAQNDLEKRSTQIDKTLLPIKESLAQFDQKIVALEKAREGAYISLNEQVKSLLNIQTKLASETSQLSKALRDPNTRGQWGEMQLRRTVELAGMTKHVDFNEQFAINNDEKCQRPDMIIQLPNGRTIIVDAKTPSFQPYFDALSSQEPAFQKNCFLEQSSQIRRHIAKLSTKEYFKQFDNTPDFVILFIPMESVFSTTIQVDPELIDFAVRNNVILATPITLISLLRIVSYGWRQDDITQEAKNIRDLGIELHSRIYTMTSHFSDMRKNLEKTVECYNSFLGSLESKILPHLRKFSQLQSNENKFIPNIPEIDTPIKKTKFEFTLSS